MSEIKKIKNMFCFSIYALSREITKVYRPFLAEIGLTYTQFLVMLVLWEEDGISLKALGKELLLDSGTLTPLLKKLEQMGHIKRQRGKKDERNLIIHLTEQGKELKKKAETVPGEVRCRLPVSDDSIVDLRDKLNEILVRVREEEKYE